MEILVSRGHEERRKRTNDGEAESKNSVNEEAWSAYLKRLAVTGYFRDLLEGSREREQLLKKARDFYEQFVSPSDATRRSEDSEATKVLEVYRDIQSNDMEVEGKNDEYIIF